MSTVRTTHRRPGRRRATVPCSTLGVLSVAGAVALVTGCAFAGDAADPPEVQALEIVVGSPTTPEEPCLLDVAGVRAGVHPVIVISERGPATVRMFDAAGTQVLEVRSVSGSEAGQASVRLDAGRYSVQCRRHGAPPSSTTLDVEPARPGHEVPEDQRGDAGS